MAVADPVKKDINSQDDNPSENGKAIALGLFGKLGLTEGVASGKFISFKITEDDGNISDYTLKSSVETIDLIQYLSIEDLELRNNAIKVTGSVMKFEKDGLNVKVHDNPTGLIQIKNQGEEEKATILLSSGLTTELQTNEDDSTSVLISAAGIFGIVHVVNGTVAIDETIDGTYLNVTLDEEDSLMVRFQPMMGERNGELERVVLEGIVEGSVASEISVSADTDGVDYEELVYDQAVEVNIKEVNEGKLVIEISSAIDEGKVLFINIDNDVLNQAIDIMVILDGVKISYLSAPEDVVEAARSLDEGPAFYSILTGDVNQLLVYIPSFSTHEMTISAASSELSNIKEYGLAEWGIALFGAIGILALAGYSIFRRY